VIIPWFNYRKPVYLEFYKLWSSPEFKAKSEKKRLNRGNDPKHRYGTDGHIRRGAAHGMITCSSAIYIFVFMRLTLNYRPSEMEL
jgi:hypothetical protein